MLDVGFGAARARLVNLTHGGWLSTASGGAYADGLAGLIRVGPFGDVPASKLVRVRLLEPVPRDDVMVLPPRWEATGVMGRLFPVLDADLTMTPAVAVFWGRRAGARRAGAVHAIAKPPSPAGQRSAAAPLPCARRRWPPSPGLETYANVTYVTVARLGGFHADL